LVDFVHRQKPIGMGWLHTPRWTDTPKMSGPHQRCGRPFGELSPLHSGVAIALVLVVFGLFLAIVSVMTR
jgi:hypothetical protein